MALIKCPECNASASVYATRNDPIEIDEITYRRSKNYKCHNYDCQNTFTTYEILKPDFDKLTKKPIAYHSSVPVKKFIESLVSDATFVLSGGIKFETKDDLKVFLEKFLAFAEMFQYKRQYVSKKDGSIKTSGVEQ